VNDFSSTSVLFGRNTDIATGRREPGGNRHIDMDSALMTIRVVPENEKPNKRTDCTFVDKLVPARIKGFKMEYDALRRTNYGREIGIDAKNASGVLSYHSSYGAYYALFDKKHEECFVYQLVGIGRIQEREVYALKFTQKKDRFIYRPDDRGNFERISQDLADGKLISKYYKETKYKVNYSGVAWVDAETFELIRIDRKPFYQYDQDRPDDVSIVNNDQYEYASIKVGGMLLTLPVSEIHKTFVKNKENRDNRKLGEFPDIVFLEKPKLNNLWGEMITLTAKYSNYREFGSEASIYSVDVNISYDESETNETDGDAR
jgi:hypothetical protein